MRFTCSAWDSENNRFRLASVAERFVFPNDAHDRKRPGSKTVERFVGGLEHIQQVAEAGDVEDLLDCFFEAAETQFSTRSAHARRRRQQEPEAD